MSKVINNQANLSQCVCPTCPSYNTCAKDKHEVLFCAISLKQRACKYDKNGCTCGDCPVHKSNNLESGYYCIYGSADETK
jgi:hypothetical protein